MSNMNATNNYYASTTFPVGSTRIVPPMKRQRLMTTTTRKGKNLQIQNATTVSALNQLKVYSNQDILICGNCRDMFSDLHDLLEHKKTYCKLRFTCKCETNKTKSYSEEQSTASLLCVQCKDAFHNAWDLMVHAQAAHMVNIYELGIPTTGNCSSPSISPRNGNTPDKDTRSTKALDDNTEHGENELLQNGRDDRMTDTPDSGHSGNDKELEELMDDDRHPITNTKTIIHTLSIANELPSQPVSSPLPIVAVALHTESGDPWRAQTSINSKIRGKSY